MSSAKWPQCVTKMGLVSRSYHVNNGNPYICTACLNSSPPAQYGYHFSDDIFIYIFVNDKFCILIEFHLSLFLRDPIDNNPALV